jgi:hypothetical protein
LSRNLQAEHSTHRSRAYEATSQQLRRQQHLDHGREESKRQVMNSPASWALLVALVLLGLLQAAEAAGGQRRGRPLGEAKLELLSGPDDASSTSPTSATKRSALEEGGEGANNFFHQPVVQYSTWLENGDGGEAEDNAMREKRGPTIDKPVYIPMDTRQNTAGTMLTVRVCLCVCVRFV